MNIEDLVGKTIAHAYPDTFNESVVLEFTDGGNAVIGVKALYPDGTYEVGLLDERI